jgi:hypothetical protein
MYHAWEIRKAHTKFQLVNLTRPLTGRRRRWKDNTCGARNVDASVFQNQLISVSDGTELQILTQNLLINVLPKHMFSMTAML